MAAAGVSAKEFQALLAAQRKTHAHVEALLLRLAHLEGDVRALREMVNALDDRVSGLEFPITDDG